MARLSKKKDIESRQRQYISRSQAIKKLQLSLSEFRRLCILKGIYPREPKHKRRLAKGSSSDKTYFAMRDIQSLLHEPLLGKLRDLKSFGKKVSRYSGRNEPSKVKSLRENSKPEFSLDHLVKERYPTFEDALEDLDDALSMVFLFSALPLPSANAVNGDHADSKRLILSQECARLAREFKSFLISTGLLSKSFVSIKGIYYRAEINGKKITWIVPHELATSIPSDVDFKIMLTFLDFYLVLLGFVNLRLFKQIGWEYPPKHDGTGLIQKNLEDIPPISSLLPECNFPRKCKLFEGMTFFLGREVPKKNLSFIIQAMGGQVGWENVDGLPIPVHSEDDPEITHQVCDRPSVSKFFSDRKYIQPQWIFDCLNANQILPIESYTPGASLPPHFSPFSNETEVVLPVDPEAAKLTPEEKELSKAMMTKRQKTVYERIQKSRTKTIQDREHIEKRRIELASAGKKKNN
jgi:pescadillo